MLNLAFIFKSPISKSNWLIIFNNASSQNISICLLPPSWILALLPNNKIRTKDRLCLCRAQAAFLAWVWKRGNSSSSHTHTHITHTSLPGHSPGSAITTVHTQHTRTSTLAQHLRTHTHTRTLAQHLRTHTHTHISTTPTHSSRPLTSVSTKKHRRKDKNNTGAQYSALAIILLKIGYKLTFMPRNCIVYIYA